MARKTKSRRRRPVSKRRKSSRRSGKVFKKKVKRIIEQQSESKYLLHSPQAVFYWTIVGQPYQPAVDSNGYLTQVYQSNQQGVNIFRSFMCYPLKSQFVIQSGAGANQRIGNEVALKKFKIMLRFGVPQYYDIAINVCVFKRKLGPQPTLNDSQLISNVLLDQTTYPLQYLPSSYSYMDPTVFKTYYFKRFGKKSISGNQWTNPVWMAKSLDIKIKKKKIKYSKITGQPINCDYYLAVWWSRSDDMDTTIGQNTPLSDKYIAQAFQEPSIPSSEWARKIGFRIALKYKDL